MFTFMFYMGNSVLTNAEPDFHFSSDFTVTVQPKQITRNRSVKQKKARQ